MKVPILQIVYYALIIIPTFCRSEKASENYTTSFIKRLLTEEGQKSFVTRTSILGNIILLILSN